MKSLCYCFIALFQNSLLLFTFLISRLCIRKGQWLNPLKSCSQLNTLSIGGWQNGWSRFWSWNMKDSAVMQGYTSVGFLLNHYALNIRGPGGAWSFLPELRYGVTSVMQLGKTWSCFLCQCGINCEWNCLPGQRKHKSSNNISSSFLFFSKHLIILSLLFST